MRGCGMLAAKAGQIGSKTARRGFAATPWAGLYIGGQVGWIGTDDRLLFNNGAPTLHVERDGFVGGGHVGYNFQRGAIVFGVEGDFEGTDLHKHVRSLAGITSEGAIDSDWEGSIRGRLGVAVDRTLFYATAGAAFTRVDVKGGPLGGPLVSNSESVAGWTVGGGVEFAIARPLTMRIEYRHTDFGNRDVSLAPAFPVTERVELSEDAVRLGLSYHFGESRYGAPLK
jgi:outer membrane immunogenic protein